MTETLSLIVRPSESGISLLDFLSSRLNVSGKKAKACLDARLVFVNGLRTWMARHQLRRGDEVHVLRAPAGTGAGGRPHHQGRPFDKSLILFEDADYVIVNKPPGIATDGERSLETELRSFLGSRVAAGDGTRSEPMAVHRLDRDTSGCVIFARSEAARKLMIPLFAGRAIHKAYHAIVKGKLAEQELLLTRPVDGRTAVTRARVLDSNKTASHVLAIIETGRTHQIRKHFSAINHHVMGDRTYAGQRRASPAEMNVPRQMLHAFRIRFTHPVNSRLVACEAPIPKDFLLCLKRFALK